MAEQLWVGITAALESVIKTSKKSLNWYAVVFLGTKTSSSLYGSSPSMCCDYCLGSNMKTFNHN